jgi:hypothetical protein
MKHNEEQETRVERAEPLLYIDSPKRYATKSRRKKDAHLACFTSLDLLHDFTQNRCDLKRHWVSSHHSPHSIMSERYHALALESGAILVSTRALVSHYSAAKFSKKFRGTRAASTERHSHQETDE